MELSIALWSNNDINQLQSIDLSGQSSVMKSNIFGATKSEKCSTCHQTTDVCQGHWRKLVLPEPIARPSCISLLNGIISKLCLHCGIKISISQQDYDVLSSAYPLSNFQTKTYQEVVARLRSQSDSATKCKRCGTASHKMKLVDGVFTDGTYSMKHSTIYNLLQSIPFFFYPIFSNVRVPLTDLFFEAYPLAPLYLRPSTDYNGMVVDSNISKLYQELLGKISSFNTSAIQRTINELELSDNPAPNSCFAWPFIGKYTLFRSLINSYSGNNTIRTVLNMNQSSDPDEGFFCREFYNLITSKIYYNSYTSNLIEKLKSKIVYIKSGDRYISKSKPAVLEGGDYVELRVKDLISNGTFPTMISYRQPSLHKPSIVSQIIRYQPYSYSNGNSSTFSSTALPGLNGDQDGDEFNTRLVSTILAQYEHQFIMRPRANLINDSTGSLTYGLIQTEVLQFIKCLRRYGRRFYSDLLPHCLRDASFETDTGEEVMTSRKSRNLFKNVYQLSSPADGFKLFKGIVKRVKAHLGREKMAFMFREIYEAKSILQSIEDMKNVDVEILQQDMIKMAQLGMKVDAKFVSDRIAAMASSYEAAIKEWISKEDIMTNDYALISYANLKVNPKMLSEALIMQKSETITNPSSYYLNRVSSCYQTNTLDLNGYGAITGSYFNGLEMKNLTHTFGPARKKLIITSIGTAIPGMISRNMMKTMEDMVINQFRFASHYNLIIDFNLNMYRLPTSQLYLIPTTKRKEMLFPIDLPFVMKNLHTLCLTSESNLPEAKQRELIREFSAKIKDLYMLSLGCVDFYLEEVLSELPSLSNSKLLYIFKLIEDKYKLYPAVGEPIGAHISTTIGELLTQASLANFHAVRKGGEDITLDADANNINLISLRSSKILSITGDVNILKCIKRSLELVTFGDLDFTLVKRSKNEVIFRLSLAMMSKFLLTASDIEDIVVMNLNELSCVGESTVSVSVFKHHLGVKISYKAIDERAFFLMLRCFGKGVYNMSLSGSQSDGQLSMEVSKMPDLSSIDTTDLTIKLPIDIVSKHIGLAASYQSLLNNYSASGMQWLAYRSLALFQVRYNTPIGIKKYPTIGQPVISRVSHQRAYMDLQKAAIAREYQGSSVPSSILLGEPIRLGTGYFDIGVNITPYLAANGHKVSETTSGLIL